MTAISPLSESSHQGQDVIDIVPIEDAAVDDSPTALVVGTNRLRQIAMEAVVQPGKVGCTEINVIIKMVWVTSDTSAGVDAHRGIGHKLHNADTTIPGNDMLVPTAFLPGDGHYQIGR